MTIAVIKAAGTREQLEEQLNRSGLSYEEATVYDQPREAHLYLREEQKRLECHNCDETQQFLPFL